MNIKLEIDALNDDSKCLLSDALNNSNLLDKLNEVLEEKNSTLNISVGDKNVIKVEEKEINYPKAEKHQSGIGNERKFKSEERIKDENRAINENKIKNKVTPVIAKLCKSVYRVFESFFDSSIKAFLKKKFKINNSVYNDGKKAIVAIQDKDTKTFFKRATDSVLNLFKKIPADTRKIIKSTKNVAIDEIYSWRVQ